MPFQVDRTKRALIASFAFTFVTECLSSISFIALLRSINPHANYRRVMAGFMAVIIAWAVAGIARVAAASNSAVASLSVRSTQATVLNVSHRRLESNVDRIRCSLGADSNHLVCILHVDHLDTANGCCKEDWPFAMVQSWSSVSAFPR